MIQIHQFRYSNKQTSERENLSDELKCLIEFIRTENGLKHKEIGTMYSKNNNSSIHFDHMLFVARQLVREHITIQQVLT